MNTVKQLQPGVVFVATLLLWAGTQAQTPQPLGHGGVVLKMGFVNFDVPPSVLKNGGGLYYAVEANARLSGRWYLAGEMGGAGTLNFLGDTLVHQPIEVNARYMLTSRDRLIVSVGGGAMYSRVSYDGDLVWDRDSEDRQEDRLFGGQVFMSFKQSFTWCTLGIDAKYQVTEHLDGLDWGAGNWRFGLQVGLLLIE